VAYLTLVAGLAVAACSSSGAPQSSGATSPTPTPTSTVIPRPAATMCGWLPSPPERYQHVIWIWFENKSADHIVNRVRRAAYFGEIATKCGLASGYHNISHSSLPNYIGATSGSTRGVTGDCAPTVCPVSHRSLFRLLELRGLTWKAYAESIPQNCSRADVGEYVARHNPAVYFDDVRASCPVNDVPLGDIHSGALVRDLTRNSLPSFAFITPNLCHDMHSCRIETGNAWLKQWLPMIVRSAAYSSGTTAVFITFDEGNGGTLGENCATRRNKDNSCHVATYVLGPAVPAGTVIAAPFTHYSMLRTTEELLGVTPMLGHANTAASMRAAFHL
jgi:phospholipase C